MIEVIEKKPEAPISPHHMITGRAYRVVELCPQSGNEERVKHLNRAVSVGDIVTQMEQEHIKSTCVLNASKKWLLLLDYSFHFRVVPAVDIAMIVITTDKTPSPSKEES